MTRVRAGEVRKLKTNDVVLVVSNGNGYVNVVPTFDNMDQKHMAGRYLEYKGVMFALDYAAKVDPAVIGEYIATVPMWMSPKIGLAAPSKFRDVRDRMEMLTYIGISSDAEGDIKAVLKAQYAR